MQGLAAQIKVLRYISLFKEPIKEVDLHVFTDARNNRVSAVLYVLYIKTLEPIKNHCAQRVECQRVILNTTPGNICFVEYVEYVLKTSSRGLHYQSFFLTRSQDIFKMCLWDVLKKTSCKRILKTFLRHLWRWTIPTLT